MKQKRSVLTKKYLQKHRMVQRPICGVRYSCSCRGINYQILLISPLLANPGDVFESHYVCMLVHKAWLADEFFCRPSSWSINSELDREIRRFEAWVPMGNSGFVFQPTPRVYIFLYGPKKKLFNGFLKQPRVDTYLELAVIAKDLKSTLTKGVSQSV